MVYKYEEVEPKFDIESGKWDNIAITAKFSNDKVVINNKKIVPIKQHYFFVRDEFGKHISIFGDRLSKKKFDTYSQMYNEKTNKHHFRDVFEGNIKPVRRWFLDNVNVPMTKVPLNMLFFDIETDMGLDTINTNKPITTIATFSNKLMKFVQFIWREDFEEKIEKYEEHEFITNIDTGETCPYPVSVYYFNTEYDMMNKFMDFCENIKPHLYLGWNSNYFDFPYIINRCALIGIDYQKLALYGVKLKENEFTKKLDLEMNGSFSFDMLEAYKDMTANDLDSYKLNDCAIEILGETKHEIQLKDAWHNNPEALIRYNIQDVKLLLDINDRTGMIDFFDEKRLTIGCEWEDIFLNSKLIDVWFLRKAKAKGIVLPDPKYGFQSEPFEGAFVGEPEAGIYDWIIAEDLASLYPNIIIQFNISPDTMIEGFCDHTIDLKRHKLPMYMGRRVKVGFVPETIEDLQQLRKQYKKERNKYDEGTTEYKIWDNKQFTTKSLINTIYGALGYPKFRLFDRRLAESVTIMGKQIIQHSNKVIEEAGYKVIYNDTDSSYIKINVDNLDDAVKIGKDLRDKINDSYDVFVKEYGCEKNTNLEMEFESVYKKFFVAGDAKGVGLKKRYAYEQVYKDGKESHKIGFKGLDVVRSNASPVTKSVQKKFFEILFDDEIDNKKQTFEKWLSQFKKDLKELKFSYNYFAIPQTINQRLSDYKVTNPQVRGSEYSNTNCGTNIGMGSKVKLIYLSGIVGSPDTAEICYEDENDFKNWIEDNNIQLLIDWKAMIEKQIDDKIKNLYTTVKWASVGQNVLPF